MTAMPPLAVGMTFRGMRIHGLLGRGAMGAAYLASHPVLRTPIVIKLFDAVDHAELFDEARLAARVRSPHVVEPTDAGVENGRAFVTQRYVDGMDLHELITRTRHLRWHVPIGVVARMMADVARGLHAVHQAGVVHRDVKPSNLFLRGDGVCCVGDFGIAVDRARGPAYQSIVGTPIFMAPEQWLAQPIDRRTDVYALGATTHLMATGAPPFSGATTEELAAAHIQRPYDPPATDTPQASTLFSIVARTLQKDPARRYPTAATLATAFDGIVQPPLVFQTDVGKARVGDLSVVLEAGDLSASTSDVIVSASNWTLAMDAGVSDTLRRVGGAAIEAEAMAQGPAAMGAVVWTGAGSLSARWVAHAVAALDGAICLQRCMLRVLIGAEERAARTVACPALGTGVGQVPMSLAAQMMLDAVCTFAALGPRHVRELHFVLYDGAARDVWEEVLDAMCWS